MRKEIWKTVVGFPRYKVSNNGRVRSLLTGKIRKAIPQGSGYLSMSMSREDDTPKMITVHRMVIEAFVGPYPKGMEANHCDLNKKNNCDWNLEYVTHSKNLQHAVKGGALKVPTFARLTPDEVRSIRKKASLGVPYKKLTKEFNISVPAISHIVNRRTWVSLE